MFPLLFPLIRSYKIVNNSDSKAPFTNDHALKPNQKSNLFINQWLRTKPRARTKIG